MLLLAQHLTEVLPPVRIPSERSRRARYVAHARSVATARPYTYFEYWDPRVARELQATVERIAPDLVHFDSLDLYAYLPFVHGRPVACTHHSIESSLLRSRAQHLSSRVLARYMNHQATLMERVERDVCGRVSLNVMMSDIDAGRLRAMVPGARTVVIPNGVDTDFMRPALQKTEVQGRVSFLGPTYMFPNRDAVEFFLGDVWPRIRRQRPDASFDLIGKVAAPERIRYETR